MFPALVLSHNLKKTPLVKTHQLRSYDDEHSQTVIKELSPIELDNQGHNWAYIDDLTDTGNTFRYVYNKFPAIIKSMPNC